MSLLALLPWFRPARSWRAALGVLLCLALAPGARAQGNDLETLLRYDAALPLNLTVLKREHRHGAWIEEVRFNNAAGGPGTVAATLVRPTHANGPFAGILWGHWFEPAAANSNRSQFLEEALALARVGVVSVMPDALWSDLSWFDKRSWRNDFSSTLAQARDFRRTLDLLLAQAGVDPKRVAFVGHDFSAMHGALIAGVETRVKAWVLLAGTSRWADWFLFGAADGVPQGDERTAYLAQLAPIDPLATIGRAQGAVMFQFGELDFYTPRANFLAWHAAAPAKTARLLTYASKHPMDVTGVRLDRDLFLAEQLGLPLRWPAQPAGEH